MSFLRRGFLKNWFAVEVCNISQILSTLNSPFRPVGDSDVSTLRSCFVGLMPTCDVATPSLAWSSAVPAGTCLVSRADPPVRDFQSPLPVRSTDLPVVVWTKENPTPWNDIKPDEGTKILTVNQQFSKSCVLLASYAAPAR